MVKDYFIGLISGTSVDGVDCALVQFEDGRPQLLASHGHAYPDELRDTVLALCAREPSALASLEKTHVELGELFAEASNSLLAEAGIPAKNITAIGSHGQTIWHEPDGDEPFSLQIADPNVIAQLTGITTVADFRNSDIAVGGQGAPLAPLLHREVFSSTAIDRVIINIGGISNTTFLPSDGNCLAFDTGPGNVLMDYWVNLHQNKSFDENGSWAASGQKQLDLLNVLLDEDYFTRAPPKSTGRELFNGEWLQEKLNACASSYKPEDVQATLLTFTATTIANAIGQCADKREVYVCGGGVHNVALMKELARLAGEQSVHSTSELGIDPDWVEAMCFAFLAKQTVEGVAVDSAPFTGATAPVILGTVHTP